MFLVNLLDKTCHVAKVQAPKTSYKTLLLEDRDPLQFTMGIAAPYHWLSSTKWSIIIVDFQSILIDFKFVYWKRTNGTWIAITIAVGVLSIFTFTCYIYIHTQHNNYYIEKHLVTCLLRLCIRIPYYYTNIPSQVQSLRTLRTPKRGVPSIYDGR